jgi:hypothetical protein
VLLVQDVALQFQILKFLILLLILILEDVGQLRGFVCKLPKHLVVILMSPLVQFFELKLQFALQFLLLVDAAFEVLDGCLSERGSTSMFSTCYLTVVVTPNFSDVRVPVRLMVKSKLLIFLILINIT